VVSVASLIRNVTGKCMSRGPHRFRESEARRLIKAAYSAGIEIARVEVGPDGRIAVIPGKRTEPAAENQPPDDEWKVA
jgi:hypothetical protein